jgi:two-component system, OmpR family, alkaline phosphatase synthesis response regulator PhoP
MGNKPSQKVLVVDDEEPILELLKYNLEKQGYEVKTASDGQIAVDIARKFHPDLVLLDIMMPKMDGVEACRLLRAMPELANTFIVFLTARAEEYSEVAAFDVGADDYILKPIKPRALMSRISALFRRESKKSNVSSQIKIGDLVIDRTSYTIKIKGLRKNLSYFFFWPRIPTKYLVAMTYCKTSGVLMCMFWPEPWMFTSERCAKR